MVPEPLTGDVAAGGPPPDDAPRITVDRVGPGGTVASDTAFGVALVGLWHDIATTGAPVGFPAPVSRIDVAARVAGLVDGLRKGTVIGVAANRARRLVGVGLLRQGRGIREHTGRVEVLLVHPEHAGNGLGSTLLTDLLGLAADRGVHRVDLEIQDDDGLASFFGRFRFREWGRRPSWLQVGGGDVRDEVLLGAVLASAEPGHAASAEAVGRARRIVDLSHPIIDGMVTYPGIPGPVLGTHLSFDESASHYATGTEFFIGTISMAANTGTYLDTPAHRYRDGEDLAELSIERMVDLDGVVARCTPRSADDRRRPIDASELRTALAGVDPAGRAVLVHTGHATRWGTADYFADHPYLTDDAVEYLLSARPALVGIDSLNIDSTHTGRRPAHSWLLAARIPIVEHLTGLENLPVSGFRFTAAPPAVRGMGTFPVRAFAVIG